MKKIFAMLLLIFIINISAIALADEWSPADEFIFQLEWFEIEEPNKNKANLPVFMKEIEEELSLSAQFAYSELYLALFIPERSLDFENNKEGASLWVSYNDHLVILNKTTGMLYKYNSGGYLDYQKMTGILELYENNTIPQKLFSDGGVVFSQIAPQEIFENLLETFNLSSCSSSQLFQLANEISVDWPTRTESQQYLYRLMRTYLEPLSEGEGELDCFAFNSELVILYFKPEEGKEDDFAEAIVYDFKSDTFETKTLSLVEFNKLAEDCLRLYFW